MNTQVGQCWIIPELIIDCAFFTRLAKLLQAVPQSWQAFPDDGEKMCWQWCVFLQSPGAVLAGWEHLELRCTRGAGPGSAPECSHSSSTAGLGQRGSKERTQSGASSTQKLHCQGAKQDWNTGWQRGEWQSLGRVLPDVWAEGVQLHPQGDGEEEIPGVGQTPKNHKPAKGTSRRAHREVPQLKRLAEGTGGSTAECRNLWECWRKQRCRNSAGEAPVRVRAVPKRTCTKGWGINQL